MKQNCNREETEGEELTAPERGELSLQEIRWLYGMGEETQAFRQEFWIHLGHSGPCSSIGLLPASMNSCKGAPVLEAGGAAHPLEVP